MVALPVNPVSIADNVSIEAVATVSVAAAMLITAMAVATVCVPAMAAVVPPTCGVRRGCASYEQRHYCQKSDRKPSHLLILVLVFL